MIDQITWTWTRGEFLREKIPLHITNYSITRIGVGFWAYLAYQDKPSGQ